MLNRETSRDELRSGVTKDYRLDIPIKNKTKTARETIENTDHEDSPSCHFEDLAAFNHTIKAARPLRMTFLRRILKWLKLNHRK